MLVCKIAFCRLTTATYMLTQVMTCQKNVSKSKGIFGLASITCRKNEHIHVKRCIKKTDKIDNQHIISRGYGQYYCL